MILAGDVGGTKTRLALFSIEKNGLKRGRTERFDSSKFASLEDILETFLADADTRPHSACFGIPGPVINGTVKVTNLPWFLSEQEISQKLNIPKVKLVNDLVATAAAVPYLTPDDILTLHPGKTLDENGVAAVIAPGTGMGQAILYVKDGKCDVLASEGGHANFAPTNELEFELVRYLKKKSEHVSVEHVLCGPGLVNIYNFLKDTGVAAEPPELAAEFKEKDPAAVISINGQTGKYDICTKALEMFVNMLGAHCSNYLLSVMATSGIYLGGGVPPKIIKKLEDGSILKTYFAKGKMEETVRKTALRVIKDDHAALTGAAYIAKELLAIQVVRAN